MRTPNRQLLFAISVMAIVAILVTSCSAPTTPTAAPTTASQATSTTAAAAPTTAAAAPTTASATATTAPTAAPAATATTASSGGAVKTPDTMVETSIGDPESLDPAWLYDTGSGEVAFNVYETLLFPKKDSTTEFSPMLATKWDISQDGKTYTFTIRQGVKFQDGSPMTPQDVAYSFWRGLIQDRAGGPQWILLQPFFGLDVQSYADDVVTKQFGGDWTKAATAVESAITFDNTAFTVTMHLKQPYGPMLSLLTGTWASIVSMPWVIKQGGWDGTPATAQKFHDPAADKDELFQVMNGTGPFKLDRWAHGEEVDLVRNDNYWVTTPLWDGGPSGPAKLARVVIKNVKEFGTRFAALKTGDADIAYIDRQYISQVDPLNANVCDAATNKCTPTNAQGGILTLYKNQPSVSEDVVFFNENVNATGGNNTLGSGKLDGNGIPANFFSDINIRKAFNDCFDWDTYIKQIWNGEAIQGFGPILNGELGYDPAQAHYKFDLTQCATDFKASTLKSADGKSLWDTGFYMQYVYNTGNDQRKTAGEILQQNLKQVNPKFNFAVVDEPFALLLKDQVAGRMPIFMLGWLEDFHDPQDWVVPFLASGGTYAASQKFPADVQKQMDTLITQGVQESNTDARAKIYQQLQNLSYQNALDIFLVQPLGRHYQRTWVQGYYYNPIYPGIYFYPLSKG
jgi:peptide/nickel transport system substrate-binding protein